MFAGIIKPMSEYVLTILVSPQLSKRDDRTKELIPLQLDGNDERVKKTKVTISAASREELSQKFADWVSEANK